MSETQHDTITTDLPGGRKIIWDSTDDALAFAAHMATSMNRKHLFFMPYRQVTGERATMAILKEHLPDDATFKTILEHTKLDDGSVLIDVFKGMFGQ